MIGKDGKVQFRDDDHWQQSQLVADLGKWNIVLVEIKPDQGTATLTLNHNDSASFPIKAGAIDQVHFRVDGYGSVLLDSLMIAHAAER